MSKIWIILKSEFWRRVWTKRFVLETVLVPLGFLALIALSGVVGYFAATSAEATGEDEAPQAVAVVDATGVLWPALREAATDDSLHLAASDASLDSLLRAVQHGEYRGLLVLPEGLLEGTARAAYYTTRSGGEALLQAVTAGGNFEADTTAMRVLVEEGGRAEAPPALHAALEAAVRQQRLLSNGFAPDEVDRLTGPVTVQVHSLPRLSSDGVIDAEAVYMGLGWIMGFAIYMGVLIYGIKVMQGVIEEKRNRVVEIVVSSVRPFQLLMGKVLGIGATGLLQMSIWALVPLAALLVGGYAVRQAVDLQAMGIELPAFSPALLFWFLLFYLGGYLLYASLFAALGSTVEDAQDAQGLNFAIVLLLVIPIMCMGFIVAAPATPFAVVMSLVPFFSPILMPVRVAVGGAPFWQALIAFVLLLGAFMGAVWLAARIYRVGILMYGKKPNLLEIARWVRYR